MTTQLELLLVDNDEVDIDGYVDEQRNIRYLGTARRHDDGTWRCLADVSGELCLVQVNIRRARP